MRHAAGCHKPPAVARWDQGGVGSPSGPGSVGDGLRTYGDGLSEGGPWPGARAAVHDSLFARFPPEASRWIPSQTKIYMADMLKNPR